MSEPSEKYRERATNWIDGYVGTCTRQDLKDRLTIEFATVARETFERTREAAAKVCAEVYVPKLVDSSRQTGETRERCENVVRALTLEQVMGGLEFREREADQSEKARREPYGPPVERPRPPDYYAQQEQNAAVVEWMRFGADAHSAKDYDDGRSFGANKAAVRLVRAHRALLDALPKEERDA